ncbi:MAG: siderophore ABC transporter substrate-binding protein [Thermomicrobiales bacterium]|nr:siderophore ABC transporter substrate-binding protein [Thermomicrobiales bacterium]MCO5220480.1 siderophore ABC transporter substrate-binding protein [Thermomicrobiales bacterium]
MKERLPVHRALFAVVATFALLIGTLGATVSAQGTPEAESGGGEIVVQHAQGETTVPLNPEVVLTFDLASADTLDKLGVAIAGLPKSNLGGDFARFDTDDILDIGTLFEPDYEAVAAANPDLIIVANRSAETLPELSKIAPTIDMTTSGTDFIGDLHTQTTTLAAIFEKEAEAAELLAGIDAQIEELKTKTADAGTGLVVLTSGGEVTALAPGGIRGGFIYDTLGFQVPVDDLEQATHGEPISFEFLLEHNPDWLFVFDRDSVTGGDGVAAQELLDNAIVHETTAWQNDQIVYLDPYNWYIVMNGLGTVQSMIDELDAAFAE